MNVESKFIKNLIKGRSFSDKRYRKYISDLALMEHFIVNGVDSWGGGMLYGSLENKYRKEWKTIYKELKPKEFEQILADEKKNEQEWKRMETERDREERRREQAWKREWLVVGGKN